MPIQPSRRLTCVLVLLGATPFPAALAAQTTPAVEPQPSLFRQVIPQPSGKNGYELLVLAADTFKTSRLYEKAQEPGTSLAFKRQVLADRDVGRALKLLRDGLQMPVASPRDSATLSTLYPELAQFRALARLLSLQQYVFLADGRIADALANARLGLRFSQAVQTDTLISGLVGIAISTVCIDPLVRHLDQLSVGDCTTLYQICMEWLTQPNPEVRILTAERSQMLSGVQELEREIEQKGVAGAARQFKLDDDFQAALKGLPTTPAVLDALFVDAGKRADEQFSLALKELEKLPWERAPVRVGETDLASRIAAAVTPQYHLADERYTSAATRIRLLACHCAIRRYRWEYDRLPPSLDVLNLGELAIDPFTGHPLTYAIHGSRYSLSSAGATTDAGDPKMVNGRRPVSLTPDE
jgi:hypothetical protein